MSDTANPPKLASAEEFDARLKRTDEDRWLSSRYAARDARERLVAVYLLHQELLRAVGISQPMLGKIRIQWWRETLDEISAGRSVRRHDLAEELARVMAGRADLLEAVAEMLNRHDDVIDDHLRAGGHVLDALHTSKHIAAEASAMQVAALSVDGAAGEHQAATCAIAAALLSRAADLGDVEERMTVARAAAKRLPAVIWPAFAHLVVAMPHGAPELSPLSRRWRIFQAILLRRL